MRKQLPLAVLTVLSLSSVSFLPQSEEAASRLAEWRKGVWLLPDGSFTIYTDTHYFVIAASGDSVSQNIYCGASQVRYHAKGMARKQVLRIRQFPGGTLTFYKENVFQPTNSEAPMEINAGFFSPGTCNIKDGIIYDSITEATDKYILLSTCNGDREKIYSNGVSVYLPAGGGEAYAYRIEHFR
jgi:hypothetical protein